MSAQKKFISFFLIFNFIFNNVNSLQNQCCRQGIFLSNNIAWHCRDGSRINLFCEPDEIKERNFTEGEPEDYELEDYSKYCVGRQLDFNDGSQWYVVQFCGEEEEASVTSEKHEESTSTISWMSIILCSLIIMNVISSISAAITVYLYFWLPNVQDVHGTCVFHLTLNIGLLHTILNYNYFTKNDSILPESYCLIEMNVGMFIVFSVLCWSIILSYNTWIQVKGVRVVDTVKRLNRYRVFGYGFPLILVMVIIIVVPLSHKGIYNTTPELYKCANVFGRYVSLPVVIVPLINFYFFIDSQRRLWSLNTAGTTIERKNKFKMYLNLKLFLMMNVPSALFLIFNFLLIAFEVPGSIILFGTIMPLALIAVSQGFLIFLATVLFRKRVIKGFIKHGKHSCASSLRLCIPQTLRTMKDDEATESETDTDVNYEQDGVVPE